MHTEEEAAALWCPFVRMSVFESAEGDVTGNRDGNVRIGNKCIASACMAWRLGIDSKGNYIYADDGTKKGFCGMAGRPE